MPADRVPPDLGEQLAWEASRAFARYWLAECAKLEEQVPDVATRWELLRKALAIMSRLGR
jgi:hypothetical protein